MAKQLHFSDASEKEIFDSFPKATPIEQNDVQDEVHATISFRAREPRVTLAIHDVPVSVRDDLNLLAHKLGISTAALLRNTFTQIIKANESVLADLRGNVTIKKRGKKSNAKKASK